MELRDYIRIIHNSWYWVVASIAAGILIAAVITHLSSPQYKASTQLYVSVRVESSTTGDLQQGASYARDMIASYVDLVNKAVVLQPVIDELDLDMTVAELSDKVSASSPPGTVLVNIEVKSSSAQSAAKIANAVADSLTSAVQNRLDGGGYQPVTLVTSQPAVAPSGPNSPNKTFNLVMGLFLGTAVGVVAAYMINLFDPRIRSLRDVKLYSDKPVVGLIPYDQKLGHYRVIDQDSAGTFFADGIHTLRTNLKLLLGKKHGSVVFTSSGYGNGKTSTSINLAIALAQTGARVVLVDCDFRRPTVGSYLSVDSEAGLAELLVGDTQLNEVLVRWKSTSLCVVPAGATQQNPSVLLDSARMNQTLAALERQFEYVLLDCPPISMVTDAVLLGGKTLGVLLVVGVGSTFRQEFANVLRALEITHTVILGLILTKVPTDKSKNRAFSEVANQP